MNKNLLPIALLCLAMQPCMQSAFAYPFEKVQELHNAHNQAPTDLATQALELASMLNAPAQAAVDNVSNEEDKKEGLPLNKEIEKLQKELTDALEEKNADKFKKIMQNFYPRLFIQQQTKTKSFGKVNSPFLKINNKNTLFANIKDGAKKRGAINNTIDTLALLWIQYIKTFDNDPIMIEFSIDAKRNQRNDFTPLKWAYYTAHAGEKAFNSNNQILAIHSKPIIEDMFHKITAIAKTQIEIIQEKSKQLQTPNNPNPEIPISATDITNIVYPKLAECYQLLFQPYNLNLRSELQDAFPVISRTHGWLAPELPKELAATLTNLALVWFELMRNGIITATDNVQLPYPKILDKTTKVEIGNTTEKWMEQTALAGYNRPSYNPIYEQFLTNVHIKTPENQSYLAWLKNLPSKTKNIFTAASNWFSNEIDDSNTYEYIIN